ncbi:MAG: hypothetical protein ACYCZN_11725 [Candidatus Dormibacteria bacterium]
MDEVMPSDPVGFIDHRWPLWIDPRTLGILLIAWSVISLAEDASQFGFSFLSISAQYHFIGFWDIPISWLVVVIPLGLVVAALAVIVGGWLMHVANDLGRLMVLGGLGVAVAAKVASFVAQGELGPVDWGQTVSAVAGLAFLLGVAYLVLASGSEIALGPTPVS